MKFDAQGKAATKDATGDHWLHFSVWRAGGAWWMSHPTDTDKPMIQWDGEVTCVEPFVVVVDVTSGGRAELPGSTCTVDVPEDMDEATGACVEVDVAEDMIRFRWRMLAGLSWRGGWLSPEPLASRKPGERFLVKSTDLDDRGRRMWWLSTVEARS